MRRYYVICDKLTTDESEHKKARRYGKQQNKKDSKLTKYKIY